MRFLVVFLAQWLLALRLAAAAVGATPPAPWQADPVLSAYAVQQLVAGPEGYLWAATDDGVRRYDGYAAVPLAQLLAPGSAPAPPGYVQLAFDRAGQLWISHETGLYRFVPATGRLTHLALPVAPAERPLVSTLWLDARTGHLWVGYGHGRVLVLDPARPRLSPAPPPSPTGGAKVQNFAPTSGGDVWLTATTEVLVLSGQGQPRRHYPLPDEYVVPVPGTRPLQLVSPEALFGLDPATGRLRELLRWLPRPAGYNARFAPSPDAAGRPSAWLSQGQEVALHWRPGAARPQVTLRAVVGAPGEPAPPRPDRDYHLLRDRTGLRWALSPAFRSCYREGARPVVQAVAVVPALANPSVRSLVRLPDGRLLVSTYGGTLTQAADSPLAPLRPLALRAVGPGAEKSLSLICYQLLVSRAGRVLYATEGGSFGEIDPRRNTYRAFAPAAGSPGGSQVRGRCLLQDRTGQLWAGAQNGLYQLDEVAGTLRRYRSADPAWPLNQCDVRHLAQDAAGTLWLATDHGLYAFDPVPGLLRHYGPDEAAPARRLPTANITCVLASEPAGRVWAGTRDAGLLAVDAHRGVARRLTTTQGLPDAPIATLLPGPGGAIWAGTYKGLVRYVPATNQLSVVGRGEGLAEPELNQQAALRDRDGSLLFGGVGGLYRVLTPAPAAPGPAPRLLFTALTQGDTLARWLPAGAAPAGGLRLPHAGAEAGLDLALTDRRSPGQARFYYRLWPTGAAAAHSPATQPTGHRLRLRALPAGTYTLEVWGQTADGRRSPARRLAVVVARPWWQHPAALLGAALLLLGAGALVQQLRTRRALREARLRTRIAADLHDEVGALLTRVSMRAELLHEAAPAATPGVDALLADSRTALATMRDVVWSIDAGADTVGALLDRLRDHLEHAAEPAGLRTTLAVAGLPDALPLPPQLRQHLYLLAKEAITNAVRHAHEATELRVALRREGRRLTLTVTDDGQPGRVGTGGLGLRSMQQRAAAVGGVLTAGPTGHGWEVRLVVG
ncbi:histidine kinase [Hymenobacter sp. ASUV-10]|uniref:Histidine kinase n=1 Tax=Hymenobacter aranciens TaxID=3063996 RepID=A0ABT9BH22_9BACT|nr:histidine kinase [Hymenobacter sp. ASUV-10]MDO7877564.1 histidine kinase [Hymenobacter sp. ASUV-10]